MTKTKSLAVLVKSVYFSIRDALAYRDLDRDPGNRDITRNDPPNNTPHVDAAMQLSTVWSCVRLISETISTLPLILYERTTVGGRDTRKVARNHPLFALLHDSPNADMTAVEFWEAIVCQLCTWGNAYVLKTRGYGGKLVSLDPLEPGRMTVRRTLDGAVTYVYADPRGQKEYTENEIWHVKGFGSDGLTGLSPIGVGWRSLMGARNVENAASEMFGNNMRPAAVVSTKEFLKPDQRQQVKDKVMGAVFGNAGTGQLQLLEGGMEYKQLTMNPLDAQMLETRSFSVEEMCRWFQMPPAMIGHGTMVSNWGTGREQINLGFQQYVLRAYTKRIEQGIAKSLMTPTERLRYYAEFSLEGLLRADSAGRASFYSAMTQNGLMTRNEVRSLGNWEPKPGGDDLTIQSNLIPATLLGKSTTPDQAAKSAMLSWLGLTEKDDDHTAQID